MQFEIDNNLNSPYFSNVSKVSYPNDTGKQTFTYLGYSYLIFVFGKTDYFDQFENLIDYPKAMLLGPVSHFSTKAYKSSASVAFELPAQAVALATQQPAINFQNQIIDLAEVIPSDIVASLYSKISLASSFEDYKQILIESIEPELISWNRETRSTEIVKMIHDKKGTISKTDLAESFNMSERTLERLFLKEVGFTPYYFTCQVRFNNILQEIETKDKSLNELLDEYGYYDRSHLEKDFEKFMKTRTVAYKGGTPSLFDAALIRSYDK